MKAAFVCDRFDPTGGGLERWIAQMRPRLERRGHEVHVVACEVADGLRDDRVHVAGSVAGRFARAAALGRVIEALAPDVVHDTGSGLHFDVLHPQSGSKLANHRRDLASLPPLARLRRRANPALYRWRREVRELERRQCAPGPGLVIAVSEMVARDLRDSCGVAPERLRLVPNGIDTEHFAPPRCAALRAAARARMGVDEATTLVLFAARNARLKGLPELLRATARLRATGARLRLVAIGGDATAEYGRLASRLGLGEVVRFEGTVADPLPYYAAADVFALPTWYDACSLVVLEALACGLPVVTTRWNGAADLLSHGRDGFVVGEPDDVAALAASIARASAPGIRDRVSIAARQTALRNGLDRNAEAVESVWFEILRGRPRA